MSKQKVLHDPIMYHQRKVDKTFEGPTKEKATTGRFMPAGADYGSGFTNPIGKESARPITQGPIPFGCSAFSPDETVK